MYAAAAISFVSAEGKEFFIIFTLQPTPPPTHSHMRQANLVWMSI